jgi:hypothetical protein
MILSSKVDAETVFFYTALNSQILSKVFYVNRFYSFFYTNGLHRIENVVPKIKNKIFLSGYIFTNSRMLNAKLVRLSSERMWIFYNTTPESV